MIGKSSFLISSLLLCLESSAQHVVIVSIDGLRPTGITSQGSTVLPSFYKMRTEGAYTDDARADEIITKTLPNHTSMMTGRAVTGAAGHGWTTNSTPPVGVTIHSNKGSYVNSIWDVADNAGVSTALYASKTKFSIFSASYGAQIDDYTNNTSSSALVNSFTTQLASAQWGMSFLHIAETDIAGHNSGWGSSSYLNAVAQVDSYIGQLLSTIENTAGLASETTVILTSDHGGTGTDHSDNTNPLNYTVPLYVWGKGASAGGDLDAMNPTRSEIHTREVANLSLGLLNLPAINGSTSNTNQSLVVPEPSTSILMLLGGCFMLRRRR